MDFGYKRDSEEAISITEVGDEDSAEDEVEGARGGAAGGGGAPDDGADGGGRERAE